MLSCGPTWAPPAASEEPQIGGYPPPSPPTANTCQTAAGASRSGIPFPGHRVYQAHYAAGLRVLDAADPLILSEVAFFDPRSEDNVQDFPGAWGVFTDYPTRIVTVSDRQREKKGSGYFLLTRDAQRCRWPEIPHPVRISVTLGRRGGEIVQRCDHFRVRVPEMAAPDPGYACQLGNDFIKVTFVDWFLTARSGAVRFRKGTLGCFRNGRDCPEGLEQSGCGGPTCVRMGRTA